MGDIFSLACPSQSVCFSARNVENTHKLGETYVIVFNFNLFINRIKQLLSVVSVKLSVIDFSKNRWLLQRAAQWIVNRTAHLPNKKVATVYYCLHSFKITLTHFIGHLLIIPYTETARDININQKKFRKLNIGQTIGRFKNGQKFKLN